MRAFVSVYKYYDMNEQTTLSGKCFLRRKRNVVVVYAIKDSVWIAN